MRILGIETSCDDTAIGIVNVKRERVKIEAQATASQVLIHRKYGGVVPEVAAREHAITIIPTLKSALKKARATWGTIDAIAVTAGPGLNTALLVGVETARTLAYSLKKPLIAVNHIEGHIAANWVSPNANEIRYPAVALVVSGGHTELILIPKKGVYRLLGRTLDDAVGEAFDKVAKMLKLPYPGGPSIAAAALGGDDQRYYFPLSLLGQASLEFSYAGLKTSVLYELQKHPIRSPQQRRDVAASFQRAAIEQLVVKTRRALGKTGTKSLLLGGGVAANRLLRSKLTSMVKNEFPGTRYFQPPPSLCMDNGVMIAVAGAFHAQRQALIPWQKIQADSSWELV